MRSPLRLLLASTALVLSACGDKAASGDIAPVATAGSAAAVPLTGRIIEVSMQTNDKGNYFEPANIVAQAGDVIRFKLVQGVHNVNFLPDSNPGHASLPTATAFAQLPGQAIDVPLTFGTGKFFYQCDPHAMLGMVGRVEIAP